MIPFGVFYLYLSFKNIPCMQGAHLKKLRRAEGGAKMFGVFRVKNHDFTPKKNHIFSNFRGGAPPPGSTPGMRLLSSFLLFVM
jgi:hypothetical protein